jgi:hypothetical protein
VHQGDYFNPFSFCPKNNGVRKMQKPALSDVSIDFSIQQRIAASSVDGIFHGFDKTLFQSCLLLFVKQDSLFQFLLSLGMEEKLHK